MEYYSAITKNEMLPFATILTVLENIILSEVRKRKINITSLICGIQKIIQ